MSSSKFATALSDLDHGALEAALIRAPVGFAVIEGDDMVFTAANARYLEMVSRSHVVGRRWVDVFPELVGTPTEAAVRRTYGGETVRVQELSVPIVGADGAVRNGFFSFTLEPMRAKAHGVSGFLVIAADVTELVTRRREAEAMASELRRSEDRYRSIFSAIDEGFCVVEMILDSDGKAVDYRFLEANDAFMHQTGLERPLGRTIVELAPGVSRSWMEIYGRVAATGQSERFENTDPALGRSFDVFASRVGQPELRQVGIVFKDVSARKRIEQERETLLAAESRARREAESANRMKDDFLATVSHELRTPLNAMLGWAALLQGGTLDAEGRDRAATTIERNARVQARLIEDLLDLSRILQGKFVLAVGPVELVRVVQAALDAVRPAADAKGVRLQPILDSHATIVGDPERLQQIAWNLISNAIKFTPKGGRIQVTLRKAPSYVELAVSDTGAGISSDFLAHVFEPFRQADGAITRRSGGLGLGLSIVRSLVEMHGGTVTAASEGLGSGATFTVRLPMAPIRVERTTTSSASFDDEPMRPAFEAPTALADLRVLVVDDEKDTRELVGFVLGQCKAHVTLATSAAEAFALLQTNKFDVFISDVGMPDEDGLSLLRRVRLLPPERGGRTPSVALTAYARSEDRSNALRAGFNMHLAKPIEPDELLLVIAALATTSRA